jgi:flagellar biosynthetic protein FlhB
MANKDPSRTEQATAKKLQETRQDGNVLNSPDVLSFGMLLGGSLMLFITVPTLCDAFVNTLKIITSTDCRVSWNDEMIQYGTMVSLKTLCMVALPIMFAMCFLAIFIMRAQVGKYFSMKAMKWKFNSLNPKNGITSLLPNKNNLVKLLLTMSKVGVIGFVTYILISKDFDEMMTLPFKPIYVSIKWLAELSYSLVFKVVIIFAIIAALDYFFKRKKYKEDIMMTKQEVKDERKNAEGDPIVKGKIKQKMRQLFFMRMMTNLPKADVIITNPTHVAVAIKYVVGSPAPKVIAKGLRKRALRIRKIAKIYDIPIIEAPPLARSLYRNSKVGGFIPPQFYSAVAAILAKLHRSGRKVFVSN